MREIPERDWKAWRKLSGETLERFCARVLDGASSFREGPGSVHSRYLELFRYLQERDDEIADIFNDQRRSNAYMQIAAAVRTGILTREELTVFSAETHTLIEALTSAS